MADTYLQIVTDALIQLGGYAYLRDIYAMVRLISNKGSIKSLDAVIRRTLQTYSSDTASFKKSNKDVFYSVEGIGSGCWGIRDFIISEDDIDFTQDDALYSEGKLLIRKHIVRERNRHLIDQAKKAFKEKNGKLFCEACKINFTEVYGEEFIEAHHSKLVSEMSEGEQTKIDDLIMLCPNCHCMIHRKQGIERVNLQDLFV